MGCWTPRLQRLMWQWIFSLFNISYPIHATVKEARFMLMIEGMFMRARKPLKQLGRKAWDEDNGQTLKQFGKEK